MYLRKQYVRLHNRKELFDDLFPKAPLYRWKQITKELFSRKHNENSQWESLSILPRHDRDILIKFVPWVSYTSSQYRCSKDGETLKALLTLSDGVCIETVLMKNRRGYWTACISSQVGCAMGCVFCATGKMGFIRNLTADEIVDQYRYWIYVLEKDGLTPSSISNIVFMGMGEPLANYEAVKESLTMILKYTHIGPTHITLSTIGTTPMLSTLLTDDDFPHIRLALSLHSPIPEKRKAIVPTSNDMALSEIREWALSYGKKWGNRRHHLTFEYVMLKGINDHRNDALALAKYIANIGNIRVNLISYNATDQKSFEPSEEESILVFQKILIKKGITVTRRKSMGNDILAACGQLVTSYKDCRQ